MNANPDGWQAPSPHGSDGDALAASVGAAERSEPFDCFISYSRRDAHVVTDLVRRVQECGATAWVDVSGLRPAGEWLAEIHVAIDRARSFVAFLSDDYLESAICRAELHRAHAAGKVIVPVVLPNATEERIPDWLRQLNWIVVDTASPNPDATVAKVLQAAHTDRTWADYHAGLLVRAQEWEEAGRPGRLLLRGKDIEAAERELSVSRRTVEAQPNQLQRRYVQQSRGHRTRWLRRAVYAAAIVTVTSLTLTVVAIQQRSAARSAQTAAEASEERAVQQEARAVNVALLAEAGQRAQSAPDEALGLGLESFARSGSSDATAVVRGLLATLPFGARFDRVAPGVLSGALSADDGQMALRYDDRVVRIDLDDMTVASSAPYTVDGSVSLEFLVDGTLVIVGLDEVAVVEQGTSTARLIPVPAAADARVLRIRRDASGGLLALIQDAGSSEARLHLDRWTVSSAPQIETSVVQDFGTVPSLETGSISPGGHFVIVTAGSRWSFADPLAHVYEVASGAGYPIDPMPMRPWMAVVDDRCADSGDACTSAEVIMSGEPWEVERNGVISTHYLSNGQWSSSAAFTLPHPQQVTESCGEVLLSGVGGAWTISGLGALSPAILGKTPPRVALCTGDSGWIVVEEDGTVLRSPTLRQPATTATGIDTGSWYVTEFAEVDDIDRQWPTDPSSLRLRPDQDGTLALVSDSGVIARAMLPVGRTVDEELTVDASIGFDEPTLTTSDYEVSVAMSGMDWSRQIEIRSAAGADSADPLWSGTFPDAPDSLLVMSDGSMLGLFTFRGDYFHVRWIAYSDDHLVRLACAIGATLPDDVTGALVLESSAIPTACAG